MIAQETEGVELHMNTSKTNIEELTKNIGILTTSEKSSQKTR